MIALLFILFFSNPKPIDRIDLQTVVVKQEVVDKPPAPQPSPPQRTSPPQELSTPQQTEPVAEPVEPAPTAQCGGVLSLMNKERQKRGLHSLVCISDLNHSAAVKCRHMVKHNYWSHNAPDGTKWSDLIRGTGYSPIHLGENLAKGFNTLAGQHHGWMTSTMGHREAILDVDYDYTGVATCEYNDNKPLTVVHFGGDA